MTSTETRCWIAAAVLAAGLSVPLNANGACGCGWECVDIETCAVVGHVGRCVEYECEMTAPCEGYVAHGVECGCLFCDGFESGDLRAWSEVKP